MGRVEGKAAFVTGGGSGIGRASCLRLAAEGAKVAVVDIDEGAGSAVASEIRAKGGSALFIRADVSVERDVEAAFGQAASGHGPVGVLVNNAAITGARKPTHEITEDEWDRVMAVNVKGVFFCTKHALRQMLVSGGGSIINVASVLGLVGAATAPPYIASKAAVRLMTRTDALLYAKDGIRVNCIVPGYVWTPLIENGLKAKGDVEAGRRSLESLHPLGRLGEPEEVANAVVYLASGESAFTTGADLVIDGGYTAQ